jgi:hypothetical protein
MQNWRVLADATSRPLCTKSFPSDFRGWPRIWSISGVSDLVGTFYTEKPHPRCEAPVVGFGGANLDRSDNRAAARIISTADTAAVGAPPRMALRDALGSSFAK